MIFINFMYVFSGFILTALPLEAHGRMISSCIDSSRAKDGEHGIPGYTEDGTHGQNGGKGTNGQDGGHGGHGGASVYGNGGDGGNGGDAE